MLVLEPGTASPDLDRRRLEALIELLGDDSPSVQAVVRDELKRAGESAEGLLRRAAESEDAGRRARARKLLAQIERERVRRRLIQYAGQDEVELEPALFLLSRLERPDLDARPYKKALDAFAKQVRERAAGEPPDRRPDVLVQYLAQEIGFEGGERNYHHPDHIYLHRVIETRRGIPLTLAAIYVLVARRIGMRAGILPLPGHVLLRLYGDDGTRIVDPFHGGELRTRQECIDYLSRHGLQVRESWFRDASDRKLIQRQVMNLMHSSRLRGLTRDAQELYKLALVLDRGRTSRTS